MRILADENIHAGLVRWLRESGHDVLYVAEDMASSSDTDVLERSATEQRVLLTDDKDFGELSVRRKLQATGIVLVGFPGQRYNNALHAWSRFGGLSRITLWGTWW